MKKRKSIAFFSPTLQIGGVEKVFITLANYLVQDYNVTFILKYDDGKLKEILSKDISIVCTNSSQLRYALFSLTKILFKHKFDYVFSGTLRTNVLLFLANQLALNPSKIVAGQHNYLDNETSKFVHEKILPHVLNRVYKTIAVSDGIRNMLMELGVRGDKILTLPNPINLVKIVQMSLEYSDVPKDDYILFVGRLCVVKNLYLLIDAFNLFLKVKPETKLVFVGDGDQKITLSKYAERLGIDKNIIWLGNRSNPYPFIRKAKITTLSSYSEAFPVIVLESFCLGKTIVSTNTKGAQSLLNGGKYGYLVNTFDDPKVFSETMLKAWNNLIPEDVLYKRAKEFDVCNIAKLLAVNILS